MDICILYSGGLDSLIMKRYADVNYPEANVRCLYFDIGQDYAQKEINALPSFVEVRKVDWLAKGQDLHSKDGSSSGSIIIPGRNAVLATLAASITLADEIWMGGLMGENHSQSTDKNETFISFFNNMVGYVYSPFKDNGIKLRFPFLDEKWGKFEAAQWAIENGVESSTMVNSSSCLSGEHGNCGKCVVCARRWGIFKQLGFNEVYNVHPLSAKDNRRMIFEMIEGELYKECHYDEYRRREIIPALKMHFGTDNLNDLWKVFYEESRTE